MNSSERPKIGIARVLNDEIVPAWLDRNIKDAALVQAGLAARRHSPKVSGRRSWFSRLTDAWMPIGGSIASVLLVVLLITGRPAPQPMPQPSAASEEPAREPVRATAPEPAQAAIKPDLVAQSRSVPPVPTADTAPRLNNTPNKEQKAAPAPASAPAPAPAPAPARAPARAPAPAPTTTPAAATPAAPRSRAAAPLEREAAVKAERPAPSPVTSAGAIAADAGATAAAAAGATAAATAGADAAAGAAAGARTAAGAETVARRVQDESAAAPARLEKAPVDSTRENSLRAGTSTDSVAPAAKAKLSIAKASLAESATQCAADVQALIGQQRSDEAQRLYRGCAQRFERFVWPQSIRDALGDPANAPATATPAKASP